EKCCAQCQCTNCGKAEKRQIKHESVTGQFVPAPPVDVFHPGMPPVMVPYTNVYSSPPPVMPPAAPYHVAVPMAPVGHDYFYTAAPLPAAPVMLPPSSKVYTVSTRLMETASGQANCIRRVVMAVTENERGYCRTGAP